MKVLPNETVSANNSATMSTRRFFTLIFLKKPNQVLLGYKTRGMGKGLWNGFGGKIEPNETVLKCAERELQEECSVVGLNLKQIGLVKYEAYHMKEVHLVHVFTCHKYSGNEAPSEEMDPIKWFNVKDIPFTKMWPDAKDWYQLMLAEKYFSAHFVYGVEGTITDRVIKEHNELQEALKLDSKNKTSLGIGKWNGFGGKIEENETMHQSAVRELREESNLEVQENNLLYLGRIVINDDQQRRIVFIFSATQTSGSLKETAEMAPKWFHFDEVPFDEMWPDSKEWFYMVLNNASFDGEFWYEKGVLVDQKVRTM